jgi:hypothetical protein
VTADQLVDAMLEADRQADCVRLRGLLASTPERRFVRSLPQRSRLSVVPCDSCGRPIAAPRPGARCGACVVAS